MKWPIKAALAIALAAGGYALLSQERSPPATATELAVRSHVAAEGKVEAMPGFDVDVASGELNGKVAKILVREGDVVVAGQLLAVLENQDVRARLNAAEGQLAVARSKLREVKAGARREEILQAEAALEGARVNMEEADSQLQRYRELQRRGMVSPASLDERERAFKAARAKVAEAEQQAALLKQGPRPETVRLYEDQARLAQAEVGYARQLLEKTEVRAPIAGTVIRRYLDDGEGITPEIPIIAVADMTRLWINAEVDETDSGMIRVGDRASISSIAYPTKVFNGRVQRVADYAGARRVRPGNPAVNLGLKVVQVKIALEEPAPFRLGMTVDVKIFSHGR